MIAHQCEMLHLESEVPSNCGAKASENICVLLVGNYIHDRQQSMQRFVRVLASEIRARGIGVIELTPMPIFGQLKPSASGIGKWLGYIDKFVLFPRLLRRRTHDAIKRSRNAGSRFVAHICDHSSAFYTHSLTGIPHLLTCHDMLAIRSGLGKISQNPTRCSGRILQRAILGGLNCAQQVACISEATRRDVIAFSRVPSEATHVVHMGFNDPFSPMAGQAARRLVLELTRGASSSHLNVCDGPYLLHVGGNQWYKNRIGVLKMFEAVCTLFDAEHHAPKLRLIMVGPPAIASMRDWFDQHPEINKRVHLIEGVSNEQLQALYSAAECLLFPSLEEGFGWPIVEAHACGCRVIATNKAPMTEVGGEAVVYLAPEIIAPKRDEIGFTKAASIIKDVLREDQGKRMERVRNGLENAKRFSTQDMISKYVALYNKIAR